MINLYEISVFHHPKTLKKSKIIHPNLQSTTLTTFKKKTQNYRIEASCDGFVLSFGFPLAFLFSIVVFSAS